MQARWKTVIVVIVLVAVVVVLQLKATRTGTSEPDESRVAGLEQPAAPAERPAPAPETPPGTSASALPERPTSSSPEPTAAERPAEPSSERPAESASQSKPKPETPAAPTPSEAEPEPEPAKKPGPAKPAKLPRFVEVGADQCIPCKMMKPILAELREEYAGKLQVEFVDVWKHPEQRDEYGVQMIPTQVIFDENDREVFRHVGFYPKDQIVAKLKELGLLG